MKPLTVDAIRALLPDLDELRPVVEHVVAASEADPAKAWSGSGRLGTVGSRLFDANSFAAAAASIVEAEAEHLRRLYGTVARAVEAAARADGGAAAEALLEASALEESRDRPERAEGYAACAHLAASEAGEGEIAARALRRQARAARARGALGEALERYQAAHERSRALEDARGAAEAAVGAGNVLEDQGRWDEARAWYEGALEVLADLEGPVPERLHARFNLHVLTRSEGRLEAALAALVEAETLAAVVDPDGAKPFLENAWGQLRMAQGDFEAARIHLAHALELADDARARVTIRVNLAEALLADGRSVEAAAQAREAERDALRAGLVPKLPEVYRLLGRIALESGEAEAWVLFERALELVRQRGLPALEEGLTLQAYAAAEARSGDEAAARTLLDQARERLASVGIDTLRHDWADVFGPAKKSTALPTHGETDDV